MTAGEVLIERGRAEGLKAGRKEGERTGEERSLLKLLRARFGALPEAALARVRAADSAQLEAWFDRALNATTLDDVLDGA
jgi:predicted transposase YdaD